MGRYVHAETSDPFFNWPIAQSYDDGAAALIGNGNPMDVVNFPLTLSAGSDVVTEFDGGATDGGRGEVRRMEDLLLSNVQEMRIEIWDARLGDYVVPGYGQIDDTTSLAATAIGDYHIDRSLQVEGLPTAAATYTYGPLAMAGIQPHVFDTWHKDIAIDFDTDTTVEMSETQPPYLPYRVYPPRQNDTDPGPSAPRSPASAGNYWLESTGALNQNYAVNDIVFARNAITTTYAGWDADASGTFDWALDSAAATVAGAPLPTQGFQIAYRCVVAGIAGMTPPNWPTTPGRRVSDGTVVWEAFDNRQPLTSVRITLRFRDEPSEQIRQLTMILSLTDE